MNGECLICGAELTYLDRDEPMTCCLCGREVSGKTRCRAGHFVCDHCHSRGVDSILGLCLGEISKNPVEILEKMMSLPFCHMHGPEHHVMVGAALLTAYRNGGGELELEEALGEMIRRGGSVPGGVCGFWGACGAGISAGQFVAIATGSTPLAQESWGLANRMTASALARIGAVGGPRCCKRDSYLAVLAAAEFAAEHLGVQMETSHPLCGRSRRNNQCIGPRCPFFGGEA